jgi:hypothetical protein
MPEFSIDAEKRNALRNRLVDLFSEYADVLSNGAVVPILGDWVVVLTFDGAADPGRATAFKLTGEYQWSHHTVGLLTMAADDLRGITKDDD